MKKPQITIYRNAIEARLFNRRLSVIRNGNGDMDILIRSILPEDQLKFSGNKIIKGRIKQTGFSLTKESAHFLFHIMGEFLKRDMLNSDKNDEPSVASKAK